MPFYFRLPVITDLTIEQQAVLSEPGAIAVSGGPGTGKSVVALWRHIRNHDRNTRKSLLLTYTKSLEAYLSASARSENVSAGSAVNRTYYWTYHNAQNERGKYGEIIIDEAQDVEKDKYVTIKGCTPMVSYSADDNQMLYREKGVSEAELRNLFWNNGSFNLHENFRNTRQIVHFVRSMFPTRLISDGRGAGPEPLLICSDNDNDVQIQIVKDIIEENGSDTHNIVILLPLQGDVNEWYNYLQNEGITCSKFVTSDGGFGTIENVHVTTYKSAKGLEFDTVIIPNFDKYQYNLQNLRVVEENDYYVVFTRARRNLMLIDNSSTVNGRSSLNFLVNQISRGIVKVDYDYVASNNSGSSYSGGYDSIDDDLPF
jgi:DNA helicase IV